MNILMKASTIIIIQYTQNLSVEYTCTILKNENRKDTQRIHSHCLFV